MIQNSVIKIGIILFVMFCLASCIKEDFTSQNQWGEVPEGKVRLTLYTNTADYANPTTRATADESGLDAPMVIVFDGTGAAATFTEAVQSKTSGSETVVILTETNQQSTILLIANAPGGKFRNGASDELFTAEDITDALTGKTLADVENMLRTVLLDNPQTVAPFTSPQTKLPVSGVTVVAKIEDGVALGTATNRLMLTRSVAKATVTMDAGLTGFILRGAGIINAPRNGSFYRHSTNIQDHTSNTTHYLTATSGDGISGMASATGVPLSTASTPLYLYEAQANPETAVIIKGTYEGTDYYYKLVFHYEGNYLDIERNKDYRFTIKSAGQGYDTMQEAIDGLASNITYEIEVTDATTHEMVSNGHYYLGISNSEMVVYGSQTNFTPAFTVTTDATAAMGVSQGTITYAVTSGSGTITGPTTFAVTGNLTAENVAVTIPATVIAATATITVGTLTQTVNFVRNGNLDFSGYAELDGEYVACGIEARGTGNWLAVSADGSTRDFEGFTRGDAGKLYLMADPNVVASGGATRSGGEFYAVRKYADGSQARIKIWVEQAFLETGTIIPSLPEDGRFYVGAFWRHNQTGERLIRIPYQSETAGTWTATVIDGTDWIKLDTKMTEDFGVTWVENTESPADMNTYDSRYQVTGNAVSVGGIATDANNPIYFRIGLKSTLASATSNPRYGLVLVQYNNGAYKALIYIRQGEAADYVMRPGTLDPGTTITDRPLAVKYSPYNLTSQDFINKTKLGGTALGNHSQIAADRSNAVFTEYPSQAGAYFQWANETNIRYAYHPSNPNGSTRITGWQNNYPSIYWNVLGATHETCPVGYRRPTDGATNSAVSPNPEIADSEQRQSLWLNPQRTMMSSDNSHWGYYADGFFDRWAIVTPISSPTTDNSAVCTDINDYRVAYIGRLFYNPNTNASLFIPAAGHRLYNMSTLGYCGNYGYYWMASAYSITFGWRLTVSHPNIATQSSNSRSYGYSIRCVQE